MCTTYHFVGAGMLRRGLPEWLGSKGSEGLHLQPTQLFVSWVNEVNTPSMPGHPYDAKYPWKQAWQCLSHVTHAFVLPPCLQHIDALLIAPGWTITNAHLQHSPSVNSSLSKVLASMADDCVEQPMNPSGLRGPIG